MFTNSFIRSSTYRVIPRGSYCDPAASWLATINYRGSLATWPSPPNKFEMEYDKGGDRPANGYMIDM
nr:unnamed protein product [Callosobruchus analis]